MERLDFNLPEFARLSWVSDAAREVWEARLTRITRAWLDLEWRSVVAGVRRCGVTMVSAVDLVERAGDWARRGLTAVPLETLEQNRAYTSVGKKPGFGEPFVYRVVVGAPESTRAFQDAWDARDDEEIGRLLGYPPCCGEFFRRVWVDEGLTDTTWPMALSTVAPENGTRCLEVAGPPEANILWRWMGVRPVPHLPCRFDCEASVELGRRFVTTGRQAGFGEEMDWMLEILSWPVEWSALHGIAEIKTPVLKVSARTDATATKYTVRRHGAAYPVEGAQGLKFPYQIPRATMTEARGFRLGLANPLKPLEALPDWYATDNGYASVAALKRATQPIVEVATAALGSAAGAVLDLGCGNGARLKEIREANPQCVPYGIDIDPSRVGHASVLFPEFADNFVAGDPLGNDQLWSGGRRYALVLLMPGMLLQAGPERAAKLKARLAECCDQVLVYADGDWLTKYRDLRGLARRAGLALLSAGAEVTASLAALRVAPADGAAAAMLSAEECDDFGTTANLTGGYDDP
jgi:SAM-dependent methyltransferase